MVIRLKYYEILFRALWWLRLNLIVDKYNGKFWYVLKTDNDMIKAAMTELITVEPYFAGKVETLCSCETHTRFNYWLYP